MIGQIIGAAAIGYIFGSIPFGLLLARAAGLGDVRTIGSGNIGATNVLRTGSKRIAALTLLLDIAKGAVPVALATYFWGLEASLAAACGAFAGHVLPVWLHFKGGKGVATYIGALAAINWPLGVAFLAVWLLVASLYKRSSLAALVGVVAVAILAFFVVDWQIAVILTALAIAVFTTHRENIARLCQGSEPPIDLGRKAP